MNEAVNIVFAVLLAIPVAGVLAFASYRHRAVKRTRELELELARAEGTAGLGPRVGALEKIVTDKGVNVALQIEALRIEARSEAI